MKAIPLTQGQFALVDDEDFERISAFKWQALFHRQTNGFYAKRGYTEGGKCKAIKMHRFILGITDPSVLVDHRDHDTLNNQRSNLRVATASQNNTNCRLRRDNTSGFKGVVYDISCGKFCAFVYIGGKRKNLGRFFAIEDAMRVRAEAENQHYGEFRCR